MMTTLERYWELLRWPIHFSEDGRLHCAASEKCDITSLLSDEMLLVPSTMVFDVQFLIDSIEKHIKYNHNHG